MGAIPAAAQQAPMSAAAASIAAAAATARIAPRPQPKPAPPPSAETAAETSSILALPGIPTPETAAAPATAAAQAESDGPPPTGVAAQCADLLQMATILKTEVAKTTKDQLSVAVVRKAGQIEKLAHKMREEGH